MQYIRKFCGCFCTQAASGNIYQPRTGSDNSLNSIQVAQPLNMALEIQLINKSIQSLTVSINTTGEGLKNEIYRVLSEQLKPKFMSIYFQGKKIADNKLIKDFKAQGISKLRIEQTKADLVDVGGLNVDPRGVDALTDQVGTARMSCGHSIGKNSMVTLIRNFISQNKYQIKCPYQKSQGVICLAPWGFQICKKVGVLTKTETQEFQDGLTKNRLNKDMKQCPNCNYTISNMGLSTNHVYCTKCKSQSFCFLCLETWKAKNDSKQCGNKQCQFYNNLLETCQWNMPFQLSNQNGVLNTYLTPQYRACINCSTVIRFGGLCKHMKCKHCQTSFCWVCLAIGVNGKYKCKGAYHYCGIIAGVQKIVRK